MQTKRVPFVVLATVLLVIVWTQALHALAMEPAPKASPPVLTDTDFKPRLGTYYYCFEFNSMNIGTACIAIGREGDLYRMQVSARTNSKIDYIYKIRYQGQSIIDMAPLSPKVTTISQTVKSKEKDMVIRFQGDGSIQSTEKVMEPGEPDDGDSWKIHPGKFTVDPFSATYIARGYEWKVGLEQILDVFTGKKQYELHLKCVDRAQVDMGGYSRAAWVIVPTARLLDENGKPLEPKKKPPEIRFYLSADDNKDVLKVEATHTMGTFLVFLDRFEPAKAK